MYSLNFHGRRSLELRKWRHLGVSLNPLQIASSFSNSFSSAAESLQDGRKGKIFSVSYLVDSLGLTRKRAESISRKVSSQGKGNPDSVLNLLKSHGFTDSLISTIIKDYPLLLIADAEKSLAPKLHFLKSKGASTSELTEVLSKVPKILGIKEGKSSSRYYDFVKEIIEADKSSEYVKLCLSLQAEGSPLENKIRNVLVLRELGVPQKLLFPLLISKSSKVCGKGKFEESLKKVVEMGFDPKTSKFVQALCVVYGYSGKTIEEKVNAYKRLGFDVAEVWEIFKKWPIFLKFSEKNISNSIDTCLGLGFSRDEFVMMIKRHPQFIGLSAETVKTKTEFLVKKMKWPLKAVVLRPQVLGYSMEKRIVPRCNVIKALLLQGSELPLMSSVLVCAEKEFLNRYVMKHDNNKQLVAELMSIFTKDRVS